VALDAFTLKGQKEKRATRARINSTDVPGGVSMQEQNL
jgi:hypothetical protein